MYTNRRQELSFKMGDIIVVTHQDPSGWVRAAFFETGHIYTRNYKRAHARRNSS